MFAAKSFAVIATLSLAAATCTADESTVGGKTKAEWLKVLKEDKDAPKRSEAVAALSVFPGKQRDRAMTDAVAEALLTDKSVRVRLRAVDGCAAILATSEREERTVAEALGKAMASDMSESVRLAAGGHIKELKTSYIRTLSPVLAEILRGDKSPAVRVAAAVALSKATESAGTVLKAMTEALKDPEPTVRSAVAESLGRLGDEAKGAVPAIKPLLKDTDAGVRLSAAFALGRIGPEGATAVPELSVTLASDSEAGVRKEAARAFALLGLEAKAAVPALAKALREDKSEEVRQQAALALGKMIGETRDIAPVMVEAMKKDPDKNVRIFVVHALGDSLGDGLRAFVKDLAARLAEGGEAEADVKLAIIQELGALGAGAKDALPALNRAVTDVQLSVRDAAKQAVKRIMGQ